MDLDGTLVDTLESLRHTMNTILEKYGADPITLAQTKKFVGYGAETFMERSLAVTADRLYREAEKWEEKDEDRAIDLDQQADEIMAVFDDALEDYIACFRTGCTYEIKAYPGMQEALETLKAQGMKLACVTNKPQEMSETVLKAAYPEGLFDIILGDDGIRQLKPDAGSSKTAAEALGVSLQECIFVGDTHTDMKTAKAAGIPAIGCSYGFRGEKELRDNGADILIGSASELTEAVRSLGI